MLSKMGEISVRGLDLVKLVLSFSHFGGLSNAVGLP